MRKLDKAKGLMSDHYLDEPWPSIRWDREHNCVYAEFKAVATGVRSGEELELSSGAMLRLASRRTPATALVRMHGCFMSGTGRTVLIPRALREP